MLVVLYLVGIALIGAGIAVIAFPRLAWRWQERQNALRGVASQYTALWERGRLGLGLLLLVLGTIWFVIVITQVQPYL